MVFLMQISAGKFSRWKNDLLILSVGKPWDATVHSSAIIPLALQPDRTAGWAFVLVHSSWLPISTAEILLGIDLTIHPP